jgi:hypothetical protein
MKERTFKEALAGIEKNKKANQSKWLDKINGLVKKASSDVEVTASSPSSPFYLEVGDIQEEFNIKFSPSIEAKVKKLIASSKSGVAKKDAGWKLVSAQGKDFSIRDMAKNQVLADLLEAHPELRVYYELKQLSKQVRDVKWKVDDLKYAIKEKS